MKSWKSPQVHAHFGINMTINWWPSSPVTLTSPSYEGWAIMSTATSIVTFNFTIMLAGRAYMMPLLAGVSCSLLLVPLYVRSQVRVILNNPLQVSFKHIRGVCIYTRLSKTFTCALLSKGHPNVVSHMPNTILTMICNIKTWKIARRRPFSLSKTKIYPGPTSWGMTSLRSVINQCHSNKLEFSLRTIAYVWIMIVLLASRDVVINQENLWIWALCACSIKNHKRLQVLKSMARG